MGNFEQHPNNNALYRHPHAPQYSGPGIRRPSNPYWIIPVVGVCVGIATGVTWAIVEVLTIVLIPITSIIVYIMSAVLIVLGYAFPRNPVAIYLGISVMLAYPIHLIVFTLIFG